MKIAVVTGATKGIGKAIAEKYASEGFGVAFCSRNKDEGDKLAKQLSDIYKVDVLAMHCDVGSKKQLQVFADAIKNRFNRVDVLVNNAGIFMPGKLSTEDDKNFEMQMAINLSAPYYFTRMLLPMIMQEPNRHIFNICSTASIMAYPNGGSYSISKFALYGMTKVLREELKEENVKVTAVLPGATLTASWEGADFPKDRFIPAKDVAEAVWSAYNTSPSTVVEEVLIRPQLGDII